MKQTNKRVSWPHLRTFTKQAAFYGQMILPLMTPETQRDQRCERMRPNLEAFYTIFALYL